MYQWPYQKYQFSAVAAPPNRPNPTAVGRGSSFTSSVRNVLWVLDCQNQTSLQGLLSIYRLAHQDSVLIEVRRESSLQKNKCSGSVAMKTPGGGVFATCRSDNNWRLGWNAALSVCQLSYLADTGCFKLFLLTLPSILLPLHPRFPSSFSCRLSECAASCCG